MIQRRFSGSGRSATSLVALALGACQQELVVGQWACDPEAAVTEISGDSSTPLGAWSTGFEEQFCGYTRPEGFCYAAPAASYKTVTSPVHSGRFAAAFSVSAGDPDGHQTRCVRQGVLPDAAYYGAWFFVPIRLTNTGLWNLVHFQGGDPSRLHGLWDISLVNQPNGELELVVYDFLNRSTRKANVSTPIPIGEWFHVELYWKRAADATGEVALYQDERLLFEAKGIVTDDSDWGQWYVGNLAASLSASASTLYVDDVTIRSAR